MSDRIRILHLITGLEVGGAETMLRNLVTSMDRVRFENIVVSLTTPGTIGPEIAAAGIAVEALQIRRGWPDPRLLTRLIGSLRRHRPDILQTWLYHSDAAGALVKRVSGVRKLAWNIRCASSVVDGEETVSRFLYWTLARLSSVPEGVVINSESGRQMHVGFGFRPRRWQLIPNGFDTTRFAPDAAAREQLRQELAVPPATLLVGLVARVDPLKDHAMFFEAARLVGRERDVHFVLAGAGADASNQRFQEWISSYGLGGRVHLLGSRRDVQRVYAALDVACLASLGEGFPNAVGEAMASAVPVVATDVGDTRWLLGEGAGAIVPPGDANRFAEEVLRMVDRSEAERRVIGQRGRQRILENFSLDAIVKRYEEFYASLASSM